MHGGLLEDPATTLNSAASLNHNVVHLLDAKCYKRYGGSEAQKEMRSASRHNHIICRSGSKTVQGGDKVH